MVSSVSIIITCHFSNGNIVPRELTYGEFILEDAKSLSRFVSREAPIKSDGGIPKRYDKIIVIKEDDLDNLRKRIVELLKYEECKLVNFGVFTSLKREEVVKCFVKAAKECMKKSQLGQVLGRVWSLEFNGSGKGCGVIAADDKIHSWRDK